MVAAYTVGPFLDERHLGSFYHLATETFVGSEDVNAQSARFRQRDEGWPDFHPSQRRGVVDGTKVLGGYIMHERRMCMGPARLSTACIAGVVTAPEARGRGVGRAMMEDAIAHARARGHALLLLDGAAGFYGRFGYTDVFDANVIGIEAAAVPATPPVGYRVRPATPDDAPATLDLYYRHYGRYLGSFHWTLEHERWRLWLPFVTGNPPVVVENVEGVIAGFLHQWADTNNASEAAADSPSALLALLQHHATWAAAPPGRPPALWWRLPPDSATAYLLADCLAPAEGSHECPSLRLRSRQQRNEGWQARPADMHALLRDVQPLLTERWQSSSRPFQGEFSVQIGEKSSIWTVHDDGIRIGIDSGRSIHQVVLTAQAFTQLVFAFRPVWWLAQQDGVRILPELMSVLHVLFPPGGFNIAGSDAF